MIKSDLKRIDAMTDEAIDYSDIPPLTEEQLAAMKPLREIIPEVARKVRITIRLATRDRLCGDHACDAEDERGGEDGKKSQQGMHRNS